MSEIFAHVEFKLIRKRCVAGLSGTEYTINETVALYISAFKC